MGRSRLCHGKYSRWDRKTQSHLASFRKTALGGGVAADLINPGALPPI